MAAHGPGVGVAGRERLCGHGKEAVQAVVVQVGHVRQNSGPLQLPDGLLPELGQAVAGRVSGAQLVLPVPGEGHHPHAVPGQDFDPLQPPGQGGAVLHREDGRRFSCGPGGLNVCGGAAGTDSFGERLHLPVKAALVECIVGCGLLRGQFVRDEDGAALAPADLFRDGGLGEC